MNFPSRHFLTALATLLVGTTLILAAAKPAKPGSAKTGTNFDRTKQRIDSLFKHRLKPDPLPVSLPNPFLVLGGSISGKRDGSDPDSPPDAAETAPRPNPPPPKPVQEDTGPLSDSDALASYTAKLKIGGTIQIGGHAQLIINQSPYKEGDFLFVDNKDAVIYLQIVRITATELTVRFKETEQTIRIKN